MKILKNNTVLFAITLSIILLCLKILVKDDRAIFFGIYLFIMLATLSIKFAKFTFEFSSYCKNNCQVIYLKYRGRSSYLFRNLHSVQFFRIENSDLKLISDTNFRDGVIKIKYELKISTYITLFTILSYTVLSMFM
jgi:hypothetical protein